MFTNCKIVAKGVNSDEYHASAAEIERGDPKFVMSSSSLRAFGFCPSKWREPIKARDGSVSWFSLKGSEATEWGLMFDCLVLTPEQFNARYAVIPDNAPKKPTKAQLASLEK